MFRRLRLVSLVALILTLTALVAAPRGQAGPPTQSSGATITGSVVDAKLTPLAGVAITLERDGRVEAKTTTDAAGTFKFTRIAAGAYRVRAERAGFPAFTREFKVGANASNLQLPIVMTKPGDEMSAAKAEDAMANRASQGQTGTPIPRPAYAPPPPVQVTTATGAAGAGGGRAGGGGGGGVAGGRGAGSGAGVAYSPSMPQNMINIQRPDFILDDPWSGYRYPHPGERYAHVTPNQFHATGDQPLSTFGADVDTASYANVRRFLSSGQLPPSDAVRVEELVNYFRLQYPETRGPKPMGLTTEIGDCPWAPSHKLVLIGARAKSPAPREIEGRNIVLLIDVSGSMAPADRLPLIKTALSMFVDTLQADDRLAIVTYAGTSGVALPSTPVRRRDTIQRAISELNAGGSTNGGQGLIMAYRVAREAFIPGGVNRVILATDGDFNVGIVNQVDLLQLISRERDSGVFLSVFGVGTGNLKDATMEMLADKGNGHYAYLDSLQEARRVLIREGDATLETVAKDVKFQVEFNPSVVAAWKLIGYENRVMAAQDFNNDRKDGGEMGAGHTVTVLYEVVPVGARMDDEQVYGDRPSVDPLRYQSQVQTQQSQRPRQQGPVVIDQATAGEWLTVKTRYKAPEGDVSDLMVTPVRPNGRVEFLPFASAVAEFGLMLRSGTRDSERWNALERRVNRIGAPGLSGSDKDGFSELVSIASSIARRY